MLKKSAVALAILLVSGATGSAFAAPKPNSAIHPIHRHHVVAHKQKAASGSNYIEWNLPEGWPRT